jgi:SAM-dependent methyltransferase
MDVTKRFSNRVENYIKYRPSYPDALLNHLLDKMAKSGKGDVADIGSGTGIFTALLLARGVRVYAVEPNRGMREAAERLLGDRDRFVSIDGNAEATGLADASVDAITAAQAFHWFDAARARQEFIRILRPDGIVALIWNDRKVDSTPFLADYERLLRELGTDYEQVNHRNIDADRLRAFFGDSGYESSEFPNEQWFTWDGLYGRAMSSSYVPAEGNAGYGPFVTGLRRVFDTHARDGRVVFEYDTRMYVGALA